MSVFEPGLAFRLIESLRDLRRSHIDHADSWARFEREVRNRGLPLLAGLPQFPAAVLVGGCQRSGTRLVAQVMAEGGGLGECSQARDPELAAARRLSDVGQAEAGQRHCFQTTFVDDRFREYLDHRDYHLIWVVREPVAVVRSMLHNWYEPGLNRLFRHCGRAELDRMRPRRIRATDGFAIGRLERACWSYNAKARQLAELIQAMPADRLTVVDYDELLDRPQDCAAAMADAAGLTLNPRALTRIKRPATAASARMSPSETAYIEQFCGSAYGSNREAAGLA